MSLEQKKQLELAESYLIKAGEILNDLINKQPTQPAQNVRSKPQAVTRINNTEVPADIAELVHIAEGDGMYVVTKPFDRSEKGRNEWVKVNNFVKTLGGEWKPAGKDSRWEIPKKA